MKRGPVLAVAALLAVSASGCIGLRDEQSADPAPALSLQIADPPSHVAGNVVTLPATVRGFQLAKADGDVSGKTGHFHVFIDREPVAAGQLIPKEKGIVHTADNPIKLYGLATGEHRLTVVVGDGAHKRILGSLEETLTVTVDGPAVQASAPATSPPGQPIAVAMSVSGLQIVPANGDTSGKTGHLHLFVDRDPTPSGQPIPKEAGIIHTTEATVSVPGLAAGEHTIWVVAGDGNHMPLSPPVMAKVAVTVA